MDLVGGLIDISILGSADYQMATALIGHMGLSVSQDYSKGYRDTLFAWQDRAERHIRRVVLLGPRSFPRICRWSRLFLFGELLQSLRVIPCTPALRLRNRSTECFHSGHCG